MRSLLLSLQLIRILQCIREENLFALSGKLVSNNNKLVMSCEVVEEIH